jgi:hypothetical protein
MKIFCHERARGFGSPPSLAPKTAAGRRYVIFPALRSRLWKSSRVQLDSEWLAEATKALAKHWGLLRPNRLTSVRR